MSDRHAEPWLRLKRAVLESRGQLAPDVRKDIAEERAIAATSAASAASAVVPALLPYLEKVAYRAHTVTDEDVEALKRSGLSEDEIFEATVAAAAGAGFKRLHAGLSALGAAPGATPGKE